MKAATVRCSMMWDRSIRFQGNARSRGCCWRAEKGPLGTAPHQATQRARHCSTHTHDGATCRRTARHRHKARSSRSASPSACPSRRSALAGSPRDSPAAASTARSVADCRRRRVASYSRRRASSRRTRSWGGGWGAEARRWVFPTALAMPQQRRRPWEDAAQVVTAAAGTAGALSPCTPRSPARCVHNSVMWMMRQQQQRWRTLAASWAASHAARGLSRSASMAADSARGTAWGRGRNKRASAGCERVLGFSACCATRQGGVGAGCGQTCMRQCVPVRRARALEKQAPGGKRGSSPHAPLPGACAARR